MAELASAPATVEQLLAFKPGDFIELDLDPAIQAKVDGVPVFDCHYGTSNGQYALKIDHTVDQLERRAGWEKSMSADNAATPQPSEDAMAAEWAAALAEAKPEAAVRGARRREQVAPASFANFAPTARRRRRATTST